MQEFWLSPLVVLEHYDQACSLLGFLIQTYSLVCVTFTSEICSCVYSAQLCADVCPGTRGKLQAT